MKMQKNNISKNLTTLRQLHKYSQEDVATQIGVSRQAVAKWEAGESVPDILNCDALAKLYDVELDDLIHYDQEQTGESIPPKGKHIFGTVRVGGKPFGFNIGYGFGDTSAATENILFYDGKGHKLDDVTFHIPEEDYMKTWMFTSSDGRFEMEFVPVLDRSASL